MDGSLSHARPERVLVLLIAERWRSGVNSGVRLQKTLLGQMEIHGARLDVDWQAASLGVFGHTKSPFGREMDDVHGRTGRFRDRDRPLHRQNFRDDRAT